MGAVWSDAGGVCRSGVVESRPAFQVKPHLAADDADPQVIDGLVAGTRVVTAGINSLKEGQKVRIE